MLAILKTYRSNSACAVPKRYTGAACCVVSSDERLGLTTVRLWDNERYRQVELVVDSECVELSSKVLGAVSK